MSKPITVGHFAFTPKARRYVREIMKSGRLSYGPFSQRFEAEFARLHNCAFAAFMNSGTSALHVALQAMKEQGGWKDGDEVIVPAQTFVATVNIVIHNRLKPVFVDVDPITYNLDHRKLIDAIRGGKTRAVIPVHLHGLPAQIDEICHDARAFGLQVLEDSCESMFAKFKGQPVGSWGDAACFSTYIAHLLSTGIGGLATTNNPDLAKRIRSLMNHGRDGIYLSIDDDDGLSGERLREVIAKRFSFTSIGHSFRATEFEAALGLAQLEGHEKMLAARKRNAMRLIENLRDLEDKIQLPIVPQDREHAWMMFPIVLRYEDKAGLTQHLEEHGIETRCIPRIVDQPCYASEYPDLAERFPVASWLTRSGFYVGVHSALDVGDMDRIADCIRQYFQVVRRVPSIIAEETVTLDHDADLTYAGKKATEPQPRSQPWTQPRRENAAGLAVSEESPNPLGAST